MEIGDRKQLVYSHTLEAVSSSPKSGFLMVGYDDCMRSSISRITGWHIGSIMGRKNIRQAFEESAKEYRSLMKRCQDFDVV